MHLKRLFLSSVVAFSLHVPACLGMDFDEMPRMDFDKTPRMGFDEMPPDVRKVIFSLLSKENLESVKRVSRSWYQIAHGMLQNQANRYLDVVLGKVLDESSLGELENCLKQHKKPGTQRTYLELAQDALVKQIAAEGMVSAIWGSKQEEILLRLEGVRLVNLLGLRQGSHPNPKNPEKEAAIHCFLNQKGEGQKYPLFYAQNASKEQKEKILNPYDEALKAFVEDEYPGYAFYDEQKGWSKKITQATHVVITDTQLQLQEVEKALRELSQAHPSLKVVIDVRGKLDPDLLSLDFIKHLVLTNTRGGLTEIPNNFGHKAQIKTAEFLLPKVTKIRNDFLSSCPYLISLSGLPNVRGVGREFCLNCPLTQISLPCLEKAGDYFLSGCSLNEAFFPRLEKAGGYFLFGCLLGRFFAPRLEKAGSRFLYLCSTLTQLSLPRLKEVDNRFLSDCLSLNQLFAPRLEKIGVLSFRDSGLTTLELSETVRLTRVNGTPVIPNVIKIGEMYFSYELDANPEEIERLKKLLGDL